MKLSLNCLSAIIFGKAENLQLEYVHEIKIDIISSQSKM